MMEGLRVMSASSRLLVANRGEIARRVLASASSLGIPTAAVYTEEDVGASTHTDVADVSVALSRGEDNGAMAYLDVEKVVAACRRVGAEAVHPGYGFLSERAGFARRLYEEGIAFVGPPADAIEAMGDKSRAKKIMEEAKVPVVPGYHGEDQQAERLLEEARKVGFPLLIKAVLGGGGKGMRVVMQEEDFNSALDAAQRESMNAFGDQRMLLERLVQKPRHIEVQVFCDMHGGAVYLFERDCSVQRRHQKVVEEAPAPGISESFRAEIGKSAVDAALAVGYVGAGTVEFIVDGETGEYFFMEMNTRLQVEHPVTEMITGTDLVQWQLRVAQGGRIPKQEDLGIRGVAIEARLYAEAPDRGFMPSVGHLHRWRMPREEKGLLRIDTGYEEGRAVTPYYDAMVGKLIVWGENRELALRRMRSALRGTHIAGVSTNIDYIKRVVGNPAFIAGGVNTHFIDEHAESLLPRDATSDPAAAASVCKPAVLGALGAHLLKGKGCRRGEGSGSAWSSGKAFRVSQPSSASYDIAHMDTPNDLEKRVSVRIVEEKGGIFSAEIDGEGDSRTFEARLSTDSHRGDVLTIIGAAGQTYCMPLVVYPSEKVEGTAIHIWDGDYEHQYIACDHVVSETASEASGGSTIRAPMAGKTVKLFKSDGESVEEGEAILAMEAMKMEHTLTALTSGILSLKVEAGQQVQDGEVLASVQAAEKR